MSTPEPTPEPTATPTVCAPDALPKPVTSVPAGAASDSGLVSRADLGIREVDTAEALAAAGLRYVRCAAGEIVPQEVGLYLLDVETGEVEGWALTPARAAEASEAGGFIDAGVGLSPGNRFLTFDRFRHDRLTGNTFEWDAPPLRYWGSDDDEQRLLFQMPDEDGDLFVVTDGTLQPVAQFALPQRQEGQLEWFNLEQRSLLVRGVARDEASQHYLHIFDLDTEEEGTAAPQATQAVPGTAETWSAGRYRLTSIASGIELVVADSDACHVVHLGWDGAMLLKVSVPVSPHYGRYDCRISPDGRWMTAVTATAASSTMWGAPVGLSVSMLDTTSGDEVYRVKGVDGPGRWLDDSSGVSLSTSRGTRIVTLDGRWVDAAPRPVPASTAPAPTRELPEYRIAYVEDGIAVRDHEGGTLASLHFAEADTPADGYHSISGWWTGTRDELRVRVSIVPGGRCGCGGDYSGPPPLAPVIESPPFEDRLQVEVVVDTCLRLRAEPSLRAAVVDCLPTGVILDTDGYTVDYYDYVPWMHVRTADGREGWASADYLRWASDGVLLEGERQPSGGSV